MIQRLTAVHAEIGMKVKLMEASRTVMKGSSSLENNSKHQELQPDAAFIRTSPFAQLTPTGRSVASHTCLGFARRLSPTSRYHSAARSTLFFGSPLHININASKRANSARKNITKMIVDPWSVSPEIVDALAAQLFAASLFPYLGFLYFLGRDEVNCPKLANFGFRFLLVFVFATIPAGIYSKIHYHDILANVDWLHGTAEAFLTITNLFIVLGFRNAMTATAAPGTASPPKSKETPLQLKSFALPTTLVALAGTALTALASVHPEPSNALSLPTWIIHVSSLVEWLVAMGLVWKYSETVNNERWKGLTWGMLPLHTSGICACTYHFFYNAPALNVLVALQAALTCFGNATMALATYRILKSEEKSDFPRANLKDEESNISMLGFEDLGTRFERDSNFDFFIKVFAISLIGSAAVKWGSLVIDAPFEPSIFLASAIIGIPTALNIAKWAVRSTTKSSDFGGFL